PRAVSDYRDAGGVSGPVSTADARGKQFVPVGPVEIGMESAHLFLRGKPVGREAVRHVSVATGTGGTGEVVVIVAAAEPEKSDSSADRQQHRHGGRSSLHASTRGPKGNPDDPRPKRERHRYRRQERDEERLHFCLPPALTSLPRKGPDARLGRVSKGAPADGRQSITAAVASTSTSWWSYPSAATPISVLGTSWSPNASRTTSHAATRSAWSEEATSTRVAMTSSSAASAS